MDSTLPMRWGQGVSIILVFILFAAAPARAQDGALGTIRQDVRDGPPHSPAPPEAPREESHGGSSSSNSSSPSDDPFAELYGGMFMGAAYLTGYAITSPIWVPHALMNDDFGTCGYFRRFPYDGASGYITTCELPPQTRPWSARFSVDHVETFNNLENTGGRLLVSTTSRFGLDAGMNRLDESLPGRSRDQLWLGDCNIVWRFAQSERAEFRTGIGFNWLHDPDRTDYGFNFTYGADCYPKKPWIVSAGLDWGTLGRAELFRFRTTAGVIVHGVEVYTGYEFTDIERTRWNGLIGGVRLWF
jgi:hypothetical protein